MKNLSILMTLAAVLLSACGAPKSSSAAESLTTLATVPPEYAGATNPFGAEAAEAGAEFYKTNCVACHGGLKPAADLDLCGGLTTGLRFTTLHGRDLGLDGHNRAYRSLITGGLVAYSNKSDPADALSQPLAFGSHRSKLIAALREGPCGKRVSLSSDEWLRLVTWVDANAPYHDRFLNMRPEKPAYDLPADEELLGTLAATHARRCTPCHTTEEVTRADWIDLRHPERSLFLAAPLAADTGQRKCSKPPYADAGDQDYQTVLKLVEDAVKKAWSAPRRDLKALVDAAEGD